MKSCKVCGRQNDDRAKFCGGCGGRVPQERAAAAGAPKQDPFESLFEAKGGGAEPPEKLFPQDAPAPRKGASPPPAPAPLPRGSDVDLGAEELEKLFEAHETAAPPARAPSPKAGAAPVGGGAAKAAAAASVDVDDLFADAAPLTKRSLESVRMEAITASRMAQPAKAQEPAATPSDRGLNDAFEKLIAKQKEETARPKPQDLDLSSPNAALVAGTGVLDEAAHELGRPPSTATPAAAGEPGEAEPEEDAEEPAQPRARARAHVLPSSLARASLLPPQSRVGGLAHLAVYLALAAAVGDAARSQVAPLAALPYAPAVVAAVLLLFAVVLKRVTKAERTPLPLLSTVLFAAAAALVFDPLGVVPSSVRVLGLTPPALQPHLMALVLVAGVFHVLRSRLLHRTFRYVLATVGVYSLLGLVAGIARADGYAAIIAHRQLHLTPGAATPPLLTQLTVAFEPTFIGVNLFVPLVGIVLVFEGLRLLINRMSGEALRLLVAAGLFAFMLHVNLGLYDAQRLPSLKTLVRGGGLTVQAPQP